MQFIDLEIQQQRIFDTLERNIQTVLKQGKFIMGPEVKQLEEALAGYVGIKHAVGCASGTDALMMALMSHDIGPGDAVFTTPFTFIATAEVISLLGATPVFVDIDPVTFNIDPQKLAESIENCKKKISPKSSLTPKAIIAVDLFGLAADYNAITSIARKNGLLLIEDAAQAFGAEYYEKKACSFGSIGCTSFFPAKPLGCYGDGGMCFTDDGHIAEILRSIRVHGQGGNKYDNVRIGINGRLDTIQAAILLAKFSIFPEEIELRQKVANNYSTLLANIQTIGVPEVPEGLKSAWAQYSIIAGDDAHRTIIMDRLKLANIPTAIYYPKPLHLQKAYTSLGYKKGDFPMSEHIADRILSLPMHPYLKSEDQERIAEIIRSTAG